MHLTGPIYVLFLSVIAFALAGRMTKQCYHCDHLEDPHQCHHHQACHLHDHSCSTQVFYENNKYLYKLGCLPTHECKNTETVVIGKREPGAPPDPAHSHGASHASHEQDGGTEMCNYCCSHNGCNLNLCGSFAAYNLPTTVTAPPTTTVTTTTTPKPTAKSATTSSTPTTTNSTGSCVDIEDEHFRCNDYDQYNLCTAGSVLAQDLRHRCQKHCGLCGPTTVPPEQTTTMVSAQPVSTVWNPIAATIDISQGQTTQNTCVDSDAACSEWAAHGLCTMTTVEGFKIAFETCRKTCGTCP